MTLLTPLYEVGLHDRRFRTGGGGYVVDAVTVDTDRYGLHLRIVSEILLFFIQLQSDAVKILEVAVEHCCRKAVLVHQCLVGMAVSAHLRDLFAVVKRPGIQYVMGPVAVRTDRDILIVFVKQSASVHTRCIYFINTPMTFLALLCARGPFLSGMGHRMRLRDNRRTQGY